MHATGPVKGQAWGACRGEPVCSPNICYIEYKGGIINGKTETSYFCLFKFQSIRRDTQNRANIQNRGRHTEWGEHTE